MRVLLVLPLEHSIAFGCNSWRDSVNYVLALVSSWLKKFCEEPYFALGPTRVDRSTAHCCISAVLHVVRNHCVFCLPAYVKLNCDGGVEGGLSS